MKFFVNMILGIVMPSVLFAQADTIKLSYKEYMEVALKSNPGLQAAQLNVPMSEAKVRQSKILSDPNLSLGNVSGDMSGQSLPSQWYMGINKRLELGNKRKGRVEVAVAERDVAKASYSNEIRIFKLLASEKFIDALIAQMIYQKELYTYITTKDQLLSKRSETKERMEHSRINIEMGELLNQVYEAEMQMKVALLNLSIPEGTYLNEKLLKLEGDLNLPYKKFSVDSLINIAKENRPDIQASKLQERSCEQERKLTLANRRIDMDVTIGDNFYTRATNEIAPSPAYHAFLATASIPLKFSNRHREDIMLSEMAKVQSEKATLSNELQMVIEIKQAFVKYEMSYKELLHYKNDMLKEAEYSLNSEIDNYKKGTATFLELSETYRKLDEVYLGYYRTLKDYSYSLVELQYAAGIWDISF